MAVSRTSRRRGAGSDRDGPPRTQDFIFAYAGADEDPADREAFEEYREVASRRALALLPCGCCVRRANWRGESKVTVSTAESSWTRRDFSQRAELPPFGRPSAERSNVGRDRGGPGSWHWAAVFENLELRACYVAPAASRKGVGSALVKEIEDVAREQSVPRLEVDSSMTAKCFYRTVGYEVVERGEHFLGNGRRMACVRMRKELGA